MTIPQVKTAAKMLLENEATEYALSLIEEQQWRIIRDSSPHEVSKREAAYQLMRAINELIAQLRGMASDEPIARSRAETHQMMS